MSKGGPQRVMGNGQSCDVSVIRSLCVEDRVSKMVSDCCVKDLPVFSYSTSILALQINSSLT